MSWQEQFDKEFPYDTLVGAHQDWTYNAIKAFITLVESFAHKRGAEEGKKLYKKANRISMDYRLEQAAKIVEEMMDDEEYWQPIARRIRDLKENK